MGLMDFLSRDGRGKQAPKEAKQEERIAAYHGMRMEVMSTDGSELLFTARLALVPEKGVVELYMLSDLARPLDREPYPANLRGFESTQGLAVHMRGMISQETEVTWQVEDLEFLGKDNDRAYFRQTTDLRGEITRTEPDGEEIFHRMDLPGEVTREKSNERLTYPCVVLNISAGGVCFQTKEQFNVGETLTLSTQLLPGQEIAPLTCQVRRVTPRRGGNHYGCQFLQLNSVKQNQISKAIVQLQMKRLRR